MNLSIPFAVEAIAFDLFNSVVSMEGVRRSEITEYLNVAVAVPSRPLKLPESWLHLPAFPDAIEGIARLRQRFTVVTCSNAPAGFQIRLLKNAGVTFDGVIPLEMKLVYKPHVEAYLAIADLLNLERRQVMMVTANPTFAHYDYGDCDVARRLGMESCLIRTEGCADINALADLLGC